MAIVARWRLHPLHLYLMRTYLGIDDLTLPLDGPAFGRTNEQVGQLVHREYATMQSLGIVVDDEIEPHLVAALRALAKPYLWMDSVWFPNLEEDLFWRALAVQQENRTVLGVQAPGERYGGLLTVEVHDNATPAQTLLSTLPPAPPGTLPRAEVPANSFLEPSSDQQGLMQTVVPQRGSSGDRQLAAYQAIASAQHVRGGQVAANMRTPRGRVHRSGVLKWFDNAEPDGRYLDHSVRGHGGERNYLLTPADSRLLRSEIEKLTESVRGR